MFACNLGAPPHPPCVREWQERLGHAAMNLTIKRRGRKRKVQGKRRKIVTKREKKENRTTKKT